MAGEYDALRPGLFVGRTVIVTGGGRGHWARDRAALRRAGGAGGGRRGRHIETLAATHEAITARGGACLAHPTDIRQPEQVEALVAATLARFGRIDFLSQ